MIGALFGGAFFLVWLAVIVLIFVSLWKIFEKAGKPGWAGIVPIYNAIVLLEIVGRPIWWFVLLLVPCVGIVVGIILCIDLAKSFGKDAGYGIGLALLGFIFFPMLAFGDARYVGPAAGTPARV
ncbi:MAG: signal peptidase I [Acidobacteria bacterium]|nr:MAG: signal peptidase I [Acidobacteriota bacterium]